MKNLLLASALLFSPFVMATAQATNSAATIVFADNSYCGSFSGDLHDGKRFQIWLSPEQEFVVRNQGNDQVNIAYVEGPRGRLDGDRHQTYSSFYTENNGNHFIKLYGNSHHSSVEFCAY